MRKNKDGTRNKQDTNIQDQEYPKDWPRNHHDRALRKYKEWAAIRPTQGYYDLLPPAARMAVDAVAAVLDTLDR
jgi:hypothetical protein